jgi:hypothetical protein
VSVCDFSMLISVHKSLGPFPHQQFRGRNEMGLNEMQQSETGGLRQEEKLLVDLSQPPAYFGSLQIVQTLFILRSVWAPRT